MAITNINTMQRLNYTGTQKDLQTYSDLYLKQSLANLGQRFSSKGDGITNGQFAIWELFNSLPSPIADDFTEGGKLHDAYVTLYIEQDVAEEDNVLMSLSSPNVTGLADITINLTDDNYIILDKDIYKDGDKVKSSYNNAKIAYYHQGGIISKDNSHYDVMTMTYDDMKNPLGVIADQYDGDGHLLAGIHICSNGTDTCRLTYIYSTIDNEYIIEYYIIDENLDNVYAMLTEPSTSPVMTDKQHWKPSDIIGALSLSVTETVNASYNSTSQHIVYDSDAASIDASISNIIEADVLEWNDSMTIAFPFFRTTYNEHVYFNDNDVNGLHKRIVTSIAQSVWERHTEASNGNTVPLTILMPYDYTFIYSCNSNRPSQIFNSVKDVIIETLQQPSKELWKLTGERRQQLMICNAATASDISTEDVFSVWRYNVIYDINDIVRSVTASRCYTMPYINDDGYWNINGIDTSVYACGKDGGQPSLIISYSDTTKERGWEILSTMNKDELTTALQWSPADYRVRPLDVSSSVGEAAFHTMTAYMPVNISTSYLSENLVTFLENAIIMSISSVHSERTDLSTASKPLSDVSQLGPNATVTTFWALQHDKQTNEYSFSYVKQPDSAWAVDFNYLTDAESIVKYYMQLGIEPDLYKHSWLVFDGISSSLKNQADNDNKLVYPVLMNRKRDWFNDIYDIESTDNHYINNVNFVPSVVSDIVMNGSYIAGIGEENIKKYLKFEHNEEYGYSYIPVVQTFGHPEEKILVNEWNPNARTTPTENWMDNVLPVMDMKEMLLRNTNVLNRANILSADEQGRLYYAYIGTSYDNADKRHAVIGTGTTDISLGLKTLTTEEERSKLAQHSTLDIDFKYICPNGRLMTKNPTWYVDSIPQGHSGGGRYNNVFTTQYEMMFSGILPDAVDSLDKADASLDVARVNTIVMPSVSDIGGGVKLDEAASVATFINVSKLVPSIIDNDNDNCIYHINGDAGSMNKITASNGEQIYYLQLSSNIDDEAMVMRYFYDDNDKNYYISKINPLMLSYVPQYNDNGVMTDCWVTINEMAAHSDIHNGFCKKI